MVPPLQFGISCGAAGAFIGISAGILKNASPVMSGIMTGSQWTLLGSTYWFSRQLVLRGADVEGRGTAPTDRVKASALASIPTGCLMALGSGNGLKGLRSNLVICGVVAVGGQLAVNLLTGGRVNPQEEGDGWLDEKFQQTTTCYAAGSVLHCVVDSSCMVWPTNYWR
ncbi:hypothetical protein GMORB2_3169 [Geosmithia morbida]|uniref:Uncharacterized protein n=1 Tax=Geosmithia morbida TaxID=1094350 RepID=A0A9P4YNT3_9HYPO|nr:uncharacterized protein GMORB2_3169 [Geosmithia morbida]KAF4120368.1 hypothetical protein GMORB2_3169 [Geosmithia morbida]